MSDDFHIPLGLKKPETARETEDRATLSGMRMAILRGQRDSAVIAQCMQIADMRGLSGEDRYVLLAYHSLMMLEELHRERMERILLSPGPLTVLMGSPDNQNGDA